ncbi:hypothetical protein LSUE1_G007216 [Lachnellula suecica]|uniref:Rhodopsin domain-containing protein n=1 Tax=Lachnellula suecica TaxID=602035 RepID=A0A8T9C1I4_9HELO|nr:hypothetical protein LSUE1_G007216 [Lachnellula suecica]
MNLARQATFDFGPYPPGSHGKTIVSITGFFTGFACAAVILRMYVRIFLLKMTGSDDWVMLVAMMCSGTVFALLVTEVKLGVGEHFGNPHMLVNYTEILHRSFYHAWILVVGISAVKISVGLFLLRLVQGKWWKV